jgi:hypothetical protein
MNVMSRSASPSVRSTGSANRVVIPARTREGVTDDPAGPGSATQPSRPVAVPGRVLVLPPFEQAQSTVEAGAVGAARVGGVLVDGGVFELVEDVVRVDGAHVEVLGESDMVQDGPDRQAGGLRGFGGKLGDLRQLVGEPSQRGNGVVRGFRHHRRAPPCGGSVRANGGRCGEGPAGVAGRGRYCGSGRGRRRRTAATGRRTRRGPSRRTGTRTPSRTPRRRASDWSWPVYSAHTCHRDRGAAFRGRHA